MLNIQYDANNLQNNLVYKINFFIFAPWFEHNWSSLGFLQERK